MEQLQKPRFYDTNSVRRVTAVVVEEERVGRARSRQRKLWIVLGAAGGGATYIYLNNRQTVPYTHRKHFVLIGPELERQLGEQEFNNLKLQLIAVDGEDPSSVPPFLDPRPPSRQRRDSGCHGGDEDAELGPPPSLADGRSPATRRGTTRKDKLYPGSYVYTISCWKSPSFFG